MISFSNFAKEYKIPRSSIYDIVDRLKNDDIELYNRCVVESGRRKELTDEGIEYVLAARGISLSDVEKHSNDNNRQDIPTITATTSTLSEKEIIDMLNQQLNIKDKQLENKDRQIDTLQNNYDSVVNQLKHTNDQLIEISKNQQFLTNQLQNSNMIDKIEKQSVAGKTTTDKQNTENKKGFWKKFFG